MPKVSVIIPSYNHGRFLARRLDSVLAQTYSDFEVIFLDDASTDDSLAVFKKYSSHPRIRGIFGDANSGSTFKQWNKGVREARGEYIWFAESDDACEPIFLETLVSLLDKNPNVGLAFSNSLFLDEEGREVGHVDAWMEAVHPTRWHEDHIANGPEECRRYLVQRNIILNASGVVFRKNLYEQVGGADETMKLCGDWATWVRLLLISDVAYVAARLNHFRVAHAKSVRQQTIRQALCLEERLAIIKLIDERAGLPPEVREQIQGTCAAEWLQLVRDSQEVEIAAASHRVLQAAHRAGPDFSFALLSATLAQAAKISRAAETICTSSDERFLRLHATTEHLLQSEAAVQDLGALLVHRCDEIEAKLACPVPVAAAPPAAVVDQASAMTFWLRFRRFLLPPGSRSHQLARAFNRLRKRVA